MITPHFRPSRPGLESLGDGEIHLWRYHYPDAAPPTDEDWREVLQADEVQRVEAITDPRRRRRVVASRLFLRYLLGGYLDCAPAAVKLRIGRNGRPDLDAFSHGARISFNLSHSGDLFLMALAPAAAIGIDVEQVRPRKTLERLASRCLSDRERRQMDQANDGLAAFYRAWTRKEALVKALGAGVFQQLRDTEVSLADVFAPGITALQGDREAAKAWQLLHISPGPDRVAAVAVPAGQWRLRPLALEG